VPLHSVSFARSVTASEIQHLRGVLWRAQRGSATDRQLLTGVEVQVRDCSGDPLQKGGTISKVLLAVRDHLVYGMILALPYELISMRKIYAITRLYHRCNMEALALSMTMNESVNSMMRTFERRGVIGRGLSTQALVTSTRLRALGLLRGWLWKVSTSTYFLTLQVSQTSGLSQLKVPHNPQNLWAPCQSCWSSGPPQRSRCPGTPGAPGRPATLYIKL
jgi:hypothetical protein